MRKLNLFFILLALPLAAMAQVVVNARIDSLQLFVGEQTGITLDVTVDASQRVQLPDLQRGQQLVPNVEVVGALPTDTALLNEGKRMQLTRKYVVTAWDSALYYLPPLEVIVDTTVYKTKSLALKVYTVDVDTLHLDRYCGPKAEMEPSFAWADWRLLVWSSLAVALLVALAIMLYVSLRTGTPIIRIVRRKPKAPAHEVALQEINKIKQERTWKQEDGKEYYTLLTDALRTYIQDRYGFSAMEMTSGEIIERLVQENDEEALDELRSLFQTADLVKFAKHLPQINENDANLMTALQYIQQTKQEPDPEELQEKVEITPEQKRDRLTRTAMGIAVFLCVAAALALLGWMAYRLYDLMM